MTKEEIITAASRALWDRGIRILQGNRLGATDAEHVEALARYMDLNGERAIVDMGCGFGKVTRLLAKLLPEADFYLVNNNEFQLEKCFGRKQFMGLEDMCATSLPASSADLVMFNYSLCLVDPGKALKEAARIARAGGKLFVYEHERVNGDNLLTRKYLFADFLSDAEFRVHCQATGWTEVETIRPGGDDTAFREAVGDDALYEAMFEDLVPVIWKAKK